MSLEIGWTPLDKLLADGFEDLLVSHWQEVALDQETIPLAPDWQRYFALEKAGAFKAMAMYRSSFLVGYSCFFIHPHNHYRHTLHAINDIIYVDHGSRGLGFRLVREAERKLKDLGVVKVIYHVKLDILLTREDRPATVGDLLTAMRYKHIENCYAKLLE